MRNIRRVRSTDGWGDGNVDQERDEKSGWGTDDIKYKTMTRRKAEIISKDEGFQYGNRRSPNDKQ